MNSKNEVFEHLIDQLRQQVNSSNPYKQQCEDLAHEVLSLKNQLRDASALVAELHESRPKYLDGVFEPAKDCVHEWVRNDLRNAHVCPKCGDVKAYVTPEQSGCRKEDTQECEHEWRFYGAGFSRKCIKCGAIV